VLGEVSPEIAKLIADGQIPTEGSLLATERGQLRRTNPLLMDRLLGASDKGSFPVVYEPSRINDLLNGPGRNMPDQIAVLTAREMMERLVVTEGRYRASLDVTDPKHNMFGQTSAQFLPGLQSQGEGSYKVRVEAYGRTQTVELMLPPPEVMKQFYAGDPQAVRTMVSSFSDQLGAALADPTAARQSITPTTVKGAYRNGLGGNANLERVDFQINLRTRGYIDPFRDPGNLNFAAGTNGPGTGTVRTLYYDPQSPGRIDLIGDRNAHANMDGAVREALVDGDYAALNRFDAALRGEGSPLGANRPAVSPDGITVLHEGLSAQNQALFGSMFQNAPQREVVTYIPADVSSRYDQQLRSVNDGLATAARASGVDPKGPAITLDWMLAEAMGIARAKTSVDSLVLDPNNRLAAVVAATPVESVPVYTNPDPASFTPSVERGRRIVAAAQLTNWVDKANTTERASMTGTLSSMSGVTEPLIGPLANLANPGRGSQINPQNRGDKGLYSRLPDISGGNSAVVAFGTAASNHYADVAGVVKLPDGSRRLSLRVDNKGDGVKVDADVANTSIVLDRMMQDVKAYQDYLATHPEEPPFLQYLPARELNRLTGS
jgi:hypothetical protein